MSNPRIHGNRVVFSASAALECVSRALCQIKAEDRLTFADLGAVLGKSEDQAAKYCDGTATMDFITYARGQREWGSRFTGPLDRLCEDSRPALSDHQAHTRLARAVVTFAEALEDGTISAAEVSANRTVLENARDAIEAQLAKLGATH